MNDILKGGIFLSMVALSGSLIAQTTQPNFPTRQTYQVTDSLHTEKLMIAKTSDNRLKVNPFSLLLGQLSVFYERGLTKHTSLVVGYGRGGNKADFGRQLEPGGVTYRRVTLEVRRYWTTKQLTGFYLGPYLRWSRLTVNRSVNNQQGIPQTTNEQANIWIPGLMVGHQLIKKWFCLDGFVGVQRQVVVGSLVTSNQLGEGMTAAFAPRIGLSVGIAF
jgi:hypothetical protein